MKRSEMGFLLNAFSKLSSAAVYSSLVSCVTTFGNGLTERKMLMLPGMFKYV